MANIVLANAFVKWISPAPCPEFCTCCFNGSEDQFIIDCRSKTLETFPNLPNNIIGDSSLLLDDNDIETLSTISLRNSTLGELHLKNNSLTHLHLDQLPSNLKVLDIRQNNLTGLDDDVTQFVSNLKEIQLSENPWQCSCKFTKFLAYLRRSYLPEYQAALRRCSGQEYCPDPCTCCREDDSNRFLINCNSLELKEIPTKLPMTENTTLLFENNNLQTLDRSTKVEGFDQLKQLHLRLLVSLEEKDLCPEKIQFYVIYFTTFIILSCLLSILQCFWKSIPMWLYEKRLFLKLTTRLEKGNETKYDCFLAYCHKDSHFVREYVERLEHGRNRLCLCFYERDWLAGEPIPDCICHSVENSKCTVILMTKNFLKSVWGRLEFRLALHATSKDQHKRLIVIIYPGVENFNNLDGELQSYMKLNTYLMRNDVNFWSKLVYALPHKMEDGMDLINIAP
ncbi:uncharacterized protein Dwil_GK18129 [Drosophila willistoni]|uniref:TIR domain-containing protein n=1 Tax=Drosophila willistoni TaxID=7260 RepID=B4MZ88_DROWI|nr:uncharacterized protein Dwil_GK18129 [Drosophila willistoni]